MDTVSPDKRSWVMSRVKGRDTKPELVVRSLLHSMGYRFRLCRRDLPGIPDIVLPKHMTVVFVHGCYWHRHDCKNGLRYPSSRQDYWLPKFERTKERDARNRRLLMNAGWKVLVIWECQLKDREQLRQVLLNFLNSE